MEIYVMLFFSNMVTSCYFVAFAKWRVVYEVHKH